MLSWLNLLLTRVLGNVQLLGGPAAGMLVTFCPSGLLQTLAQVLRLSSGCRTTWLLEHGAYELGLNFMRAQLVWYLFIVGSGVRCLVLTTAAAGLASIEATFRNARWLERESAEMGDIWFAHKRDRRALFLVPLLYWAPLRRVFPTAGFFELRLAPATQKLTAYHITWLD